MFAEAFFRARPRERKASSAWRESVSTRRQTRQTIGPWPLHQRRERRLGTFRVASHTLFQELPIGQVTERTDLERGVNLPQDGCSSLFLPRQGFTSPSHAADCLAE